VMLYLTISVLFIYDNSGLEINIFDCPEISSELNKISTNKRELLISLTGSWIV
jgi:hypothetical protein